MYEWLNNNYWKAEDLSYLNDIQTQTVYLDEWWVEDKYPFRVFRTIDRDASGMLGYMKQVLGTQGATTMAGTMQMMQYLDGWNLKSMYYEGSTKRYKPDNAVGYKHEDTAKMYSNLNMVNYYKKRQSKCKNGSQKYKEYAQMIDMYAEYVLEYQDKFPERLV